MKKIAIFTLILLFAVSGIKAQITHTISDNGFAFDPETLNVNVGDSVIFIGSSSHPVVEVSETTWNNNGSTALAGGFSFPSGSGGIKVDAAGTRYYVCTAHVASKGMKGKIIVSVPTALRDLSDAGSSVYPLPLTGNELTVAFKNPVQQHLEILIYDIAGNLRLSTMGSTTDGIYKVDCSTLPRGIFLLKMQGDNENVSAKVVRE
jgi:plastocyanin